MKDNSEKDTARVLHILDAITEIESFLKGVDYTAFEKSSLLQSACIRQLEIIGEAASHISDASKKNVSDIGWREITGLRNILIHEYFGIDIRLVWEIIMKDIPSFKTKIEQLLSSLS